MRISDWSSDVCSSDLGVEPRPAEGGAESGGVDGDDRLEAGRLVVAEDDLLVAGAAFEHAGGLWCGHGGDPSWSGTRGSDERRVGEECVSSCRSRRSTYP